jgi:hypothetical protein
LEDSGPLEELQRDLEEVAERLENPEASRLEALADISSLADEMSARREALERQLGETLDFATDPSAEMTREIQEAMENGDMETAQEALEELMEELQERMEEGDLTAEDMQQLASEMQQMSEQLGGEQSQTGQSLQMAAQACQMAAEGMQGQQGDGTAGAQAQQGMASQSMQQAMASMSTAMSDLADAQEQLSIAEALEADLNATRASLAQRPRSGQMCDACRTGSGECEGGNCPGGGRGRNWRLSRTAGQWAPGDTDSQGPGMGGPGQGRGGNAPIGDSDPTFRDEQLQAQHGPGVIIATLRHDDGIQIEGESTLQAADVYLAAEQRAEEVLETEVIPAGYRTITREYFSGIQQGSRSDAEESDSPAEESGDVE